MLVEHSVVCRMFRLKLTMKKIEEVTGYPRRSIKRILIKHNIVKNRGLHGSKAIVQYDTEGNKIAEYPSATQAYCRTGISQGAIGRCARGEQKLAGGYVFKFKEKYE